MAATAQTNDQDIYPREDAAMVRQVDGQTVAVRPLKRVKTPTGEDAVAERIIVAFSTAIDTAAITDAHTTAASGGAGKARPVLDLGDNTFLVDVSGPRRSHAQWTRIARIRVSVPRRRPSLTLHPQCGARPASRMHNTRRFS